MSPGPLDLADRLLWPDGDVSVTPDRVGEALVKLGARGALDRLFVTAPSSEVERYNQFADRPLTAKSGVRGDLFPPPWTLPEAYKYLDLDGYLTELADRVERDDLYEARLQRLAIEIALFKAHQLDDVLRALIYVIDTLRAKKVVWGVGRGSSCSSYLLFLLGLHDVDPVKYDIKITDFIKT